MSPVGLSTPKRTDPQPLTSSFRSPDPDRARADRPAPSRAAPLERGCRAPRSPRTGTSTIPACAARGSSWSRRGRSHRPLSRPRRQRQPCPRPRAGAPSRRPLTRATRSPLESSCGVSTPRSGRLGAASTRTRSRTCLRTARSIRARRRRFPRAFLEAVPQRLKLQEPVLPPKAEAVTDLLLDLEETGFLVWQGRAQKRTAYGHLDGPHAATRLAVLRPFVRTAYGRSRGTVHGRPAVLTLYAGSASPGGRTRSPRRTPDRRPARPW